MLRLAANLSTLYRPHRLTDAFGLAAQAGFRLVEMQYPYSEVAADFRRAADGAGLQTVLINAPAGDPSQGRTGLAAASDDRPAFRESLDWALEYARVLDCPRIHVLVGRLPDGETAAQSPLVVENLRLAADRFAAQGVTLMVEALNRTTNPGYAVPTIEAADALRAAVGRPNVALQADTFHAEMAGGDSLRRILPLLDRIGHVQVAGAPERREPDLGELDIHGLLGALDKAGYAGVVGCEYFPTNSAHPDFGWARRYGLS